MSHDNEKKQPDKKQTPQVYGEFSPDKWVSLADALWNPKISVAALATFIEQNGIKTIDQTNRIIDATDGEEKEASSKANAINLLALFCADEEVYHEGEGVNPSRWQEYDSPMQKFGWQKDEVPEDPDEFAKWISNPILKKATKSSVTMKDTNLSDQEEKGKDSSDASPVSNVKPDNDKTLSNLFDPVTVEALEKMFPADGKWKGWAERAARNKLINTRKEREKFNPYEAAMWFVEQGHKGMGFGALLSCVSK